MKSLLVLNNPGLFSSCFHLNDSAIISLAKEVKYFRTSVICQVIYTIII